MAQTYPGKTNIRIAGVYTQFQWDGKILAFARGVRDEGPRPVAAPVAVQPLDAPYPLEIVQSAALGPGTLQVRVFERFGSRVWDDIMGAISGIGNINFNDLRQISVTLAAMNRPINALKVITQPNGTSYGDLYLNCKITDIGDTEDVQNETMEIVKNVTITYTRKIRTDSGLYSSNAGGNGALNNSAINSANTSDTRATIPITF